MSSLYIVRVNVDNQDFPTCSFPARALPSSGLLTFLQSFLCGVNNECSPMNQFDEIPTYEDSKLTQLQRKFSPLIYNETVLDVAGTTPDALKLLSTLTDIVDQPTFVDISKNGLRVKDLFKSPDRVKRTIASELHLPNEVTDAVMSAEISFQGLLKGGLDRCSAQFLSDILTIQDKEQVDILAKKLCSLSDEQLQKIAIKLMMEVNFEKYIVMVGDMYYKLSGDNSISQLGATLSAVMHMTRIESFLPPELVNLFLGTDAEFSYFNMTIIPKIIKTFEPTFGDTEVYKTLNDLSEALVTGVRYLNRIVKPATNSAIDDLRVKEDGPISILPAAQLFRNAITVFEETTNNTSDGVFNVIGQITKFIYKFLPDDIKFEVSFYSTLFAKLMEGALKVIDINTHIQQMAYDVSLRNADGVKVLTSLPVNVVGKGFDALADAERTQILTSKLNFPNQMFCDSSRIAGFFWISKNEADDLKNILCTNAWKAYISDLIKSFGIYDVKDNINIMASLVIQRTLGKDVTDQLYSLERTFDVIKNFTNALSKIHEVEKPEVEWLKLFNVTEDSEFMKVVKAKGHLGKQMLITVHGALAKEVVKQNPLLEYKISPTLIDITTIVGAINEQLGLMPPELIVKLKKQYPDILQTMLLTMLSEEKTYKCLSTSSNDIVCSNNRTLASASSYLEFPATAEDDLVSTLCDTSEVIENGLKADSIIAKAIVKVSNSSHSPLEMINWTKLINNVKGLYMKLNTDLPYLFEYKTYGMNEEVQSRVMQLMEAAKEFWFNLSHIDRSVHLSLKLLFRLLDLMDHEIFNISDKVWITVKQVLSVSTGPFNIIADIIEDLNALISNKETYTSKLPGKTTMALSAIVPNVPHLFVDLANIIVNDDTDTTPIIALMNSNPPWPCSTISISEHLTLSDNSKMAVKGMETLICLDMELQQEWKDYIDENSLNESSPHIFLKFSSVLDSLISGVSSLRLILSDVFNENSTVINGDMSLMAAWKYAVDTINASDKNVTFSNFFTKFDTVLTAVNTGVTNQPTSSIWEDFVKCSNKSLITDDCKLIGRAAWKFTLESLSVALENMAGDLMTYFKEVHEPDSNLLQLLGFTRRTGLYILYDKLPEFIGTLINSYWDYGFMTQIRRASLSEFWDCEAVLDSLVPLPGNGIDSSTIEKVKPLVCPSLLHWISLPRGDNTLLDVIAKPQYYFFTLPVQNLSSSYKNAFNKATDLTNLLMEIAKENETLITENDVKLNTIQDKVSKTVDKILNYKINASDPSYRLYTEINRKQIHSMTYLTRIVAVINKLATAMDNLKVDEIKTDQNEADLKKLDKDLYSIQKMFKRRPSDAVALHFDVLTKIVWTNDKRFQIVNGLDEMCEDMKTNDTTNDILNEGDRLKAQICAKNYKSVYGAIENTITEDFEDSKQALSKLVDVLQYGDIQNITNISEFLNQRKQLIKTMKSSIKYAYDLSIPVYLKYLQNSLENYNVILSFLAGDDWWGELRTLYNGPHANTFLDTVEMSCDIAEDILSKLDNIHLVRLLHDIDVNNSAAFCRSNVTLSDYIPDVTGALSKLKQDVCGTDRVEVLREIPPLVFASQGYDSNLKLSKDVNYTTLNDVILKTEFNLKKVEDGPKSPEKPSWISDDKISRLRKVASQLMSKESLTKIAFGLTGNVVDASTLFLNNSQCVLCSKFTSWFKQINLQLIKKQEYDNLLCHLPTMSLEEVHHTLKNDFHWDMAIRELISSRNYTKYEMNKSVNEMLEQVKLHLLEDLTSNSSKLEGCLARNVSRNEFGNATIFLSVLAYTIRMVRAELPHFHEVEGIKEVPYLKKLASEVAHKLEVIAPLKEYLLKDNNLSKQLRSVVSNDLAKEIEDADINLHLIGNYTQLSIKKYLRLSKHDWFNVCNDTNCDVLSDMVYKNINKTLVNKNLPKLQSEEYWRFTFASNILYHVENIIHHASRLLGLASNLDVSGAMEGRLTSVIDLLMEILSDYMLNGIVYSVQGIENVLQPILHGTPLEFDLDAVTKGLVILNDMRRQLVEQDELKVEVSTLFSDPERLETAMNRIGINNTNFWSIAAPRIHAGHLKLKPLFTSKAGDYHISRFVCHPDWMSKVIAPANLDVVTAEDVYAAVIDQFCVISDGQAKKVALVMMQNLNFSFIMDQVTEVLLVKLYNASQLTESEGAAVLHSLPQMAALLPTIQSSVGDLTDNLAKEPLFQELKNFSSVGSLLSSANFMSSAGSMMCGKPFYPNVNRFYKTVVQAKDFSSEPDQAQLDVLPTDFCRSLYSDIINVEGGKIVWSFVKPLLMGKILYTPDTPLVHRIIEKANASFAHMTKLTGLVHSFSRSFSSVDKLSKHKDGVAALRNILRSPSFGELRNSLLGDWEIPDMDVDGLFDDFDDLKGIGNLLTKASDLLQCINLNRFHAMPDEYQLIHNAAKLSVVNEFSAGLVFLNAEKYTEVPTNIEYKIRMDIDNVPTTTRTRNYMWTPGPEANFLEDMRYFRGFIQIQDLVDRAIIDLARNKTRSKREAREEMKWAVYTQQTPYPCYRKDFFQTSLYESQALLVAFFFSLLYTVASAVRFMVADKESGNTMLMSVMGVDLSYHTLSWFIASLTEMTATCACVAAVLWLGGILPRTAPSLIFSILFVFGVSVLCFCYMLSKLFSQASLAAVCSAIAYLITFMPIVLILSLEAVMSASYKIIVCLSMSSALCYSFLYIARYEAMGVGATWDQLWTAPVDGEDMSIGMAAAMLVFDAGLYLAIGWLIDRFFGPKTLRSNITHCVTSGEKAGVSIVNITKVYNEGSRRQKLALDNVSVELHKGQITTLLGHNGAGKTTLINILTGMLKPTKGHVTIRSESPSGTRLGLCPQKDVLFEYMSAREHVALYAQLKTGLSMEAVRDEVESMLQVLSLGQMASSPVCRLSGGTRRRVCVGLAFVGRPQLVVLDEPTAGVDPAARRDIWSMIVKLKEDRTILLTTHHLDEAELLSDQIVIMHKGQIHTTGSPIEIKRTLGTGYKLNVFFPKKEDLPDEEDFSIEEKTKELLALVRDIIKNGYLMDVIGVEVEIALPFFDTNGLNNNFLQLCEVLEGAQSALGYQNYSLDCSSLEQVFFNICDQMDTAPHSIEYMPEDSPSKSASSTSIRNDSVPLVSGDGPLKGTLCQQFLALLYARYIHYTRNRWLLFLLIVLPSLFVTIAMAFSTIRPPADNEISLKLDPSLYQNATEFIISSPSVYSKDMDPSFAQNVMATLRMDKEFKNWTKDDTPTCACSETHQICNFTDTQTRPRMMILPNVNVTNDWLIATQEMYIEKRYGGFSSALKNNKTILVAWYNNKGHHSMPAFLSALNTAALKAAAGESASITTYSHPMKISKEQISKDTVYQHVADAGISGLVLIACSLVGAGSAAALVAARVSQQKRLHYLSGVPPALYWGVALAWDMIIITINMVITVIVMEAFHFPVFVARNNLPAICVLILLFGYACGNLVHLSEKLFTDPSMANMVLFCGNTFLGLSGIALLLILDIISESEATDNARWVLHKIFMLSPQFALGDGLLEIAKNTIQAQVLGRFGMETYRDPFSSDLIALHCTALVVVGTFLMLLNLAVEYDYFEGILARFSKESIPEQSGEMEEVEVSEERRRVKNAISRAGDAQVTLRTIGNINAGFVNTEDCNKKSPKRMASADSDVAACVDLSKVYWTLGKPRVAVRALTLGFPAGQCTALLGQNGAGKSTTFAMLTGQVRPSSGQVYLHGRPVSARQLCQGHISYCPQSDAIDPLMTVRETLIMYCRLRGITEQDDVIRRTLDAFSLSRYGDVRCGALSGGNKRKLCAAIAMMGRNDLVLLDEPTSGMDPASRACVRRAVRAACARGRGVLLSTHALADARRLAARVALLRAALALVAGLHSPHR
ncbi:uncharacterized protein LOC106140036 isoform X2 [Amyelois transitella]|nr:uncharacterized protein LOC106140036 isoform X2 [Amyelois transitella]